MRFDRDRLTFLALCVLDDVCYRCQRGPVQASPPIRLALAVLYALGSGPKQLFDDFWREMRNPYSEQSHPSQGNTLRANYATTYFAGIARSVGVDLSMDYERRLAGARKEREVVAP